MKIEKILLLIILCGILLCGCTNTAKYDPERNNAWIEDIKEVEMAITAFHPDPFKYISETEFKSDINTLKDNVSKMDDHEITVQLEKILAKMKDLHTWVRYNSKIAYPFQIRYFGDELYITITTEEYKDILFKKIIEIEGESIDIIEKKVAEISSFENKIGEKYEVSRKLSEPSVLFGLKIVKDLDNIDLTLEDEKGNKEKITIASVDYSTMDIQPKIYNVNSYCEPPMYMKNKDKAYYYEYLKEYNGIYIDLNNFVDNNLSNFMDRLFSEIEETEPEKLIIDVRDNLGGQISNYLLFKRKFDYFKNMNKIDDYEIFVITNNYTVSTSILITQYIVNSLSATMIGEPPAQPFKFFAMTNVYTSNNSKLRYMFSKHEEGEGESLIVIEPDIYIPLSIEEYKTGEDPVMEYILEKGGR